MAGRNLKEALEKIGHRGGGSLCARTLGSVAALLRQWSTGDRQQCGGASVARRRAGKKKLSFRRLGWRRRKCRSHVQPDRNGETKRTRPGKLPAQRTVSHRRSSHQPHRRTAPLECRGRSCRTLTPRCLIDPICCQDGRVQSLTFFCDESGKYRKNPVVSITGIGADRPRVDQFDKQWKALLDS